MCIVASYVIDLSLFQRFLGSLRKNYYLIASELEKNQYKALATI